jgi:Spy/CpxP family protein refolding chaperone
MTTETLHDTESKSRGPRLSRFRRLALLALPLAGLLAVSSAYANTDDDAGQGAGQWHHGRGGERMGFPLHHLLGAAGATEAQKAQIKAIFVGLRPQMQSLRTERMKVHQQLAQALTAPTVDPGTVERLRQQQVKLADQSSALMTQGLVKASQVLTPEQRQKVSAELGKHHNR